MIKVFVINGYAGAGKDTFVELVKGHAKTAGIDTFNLVSSVPAKNALRALGWGGTEKTPEVRNALAYLMDLSSELFDHPFKVVESHINSFEAIYNGDRDALVFIHSREPNNIQRYKERWNAQTVFVARENCVIPGNHADSDEVENYRYDITVYNYGTYKDLSNIAYRFVKERCK